MSNMNAYKAYCRYYQAQSGGEIPVFRGGLQSGEGMGDVLHGMLRHAVPVAIKGLGAFASTLLDNHHKGAELKEAAIQALKPTLSAVVSGISDQMRGNDQSGSGFKRKRKPHSHGSITQHDVYKKRKLKRRTNGQFQSAKHEHFNF
jgi:hypothetical protein